MIEHDKEWLSTNANNMKRRSFLKSTLAAIAFTASGLRLAEGGLTLVEPEKVPAMCLEIGDQKIWLFDGDNEFDEGFASGSATINHSDGVLLKSLEVFSGTNEKVSIWVEDSLTIDGPVITHSNPIELPDGDVRFKSTTKSIPHDDFFEMIEIEG